MNIKTPNNISNANRNNSKYMFFKAKQIEGTNDDLLKGQLANLVNEEGLRDHSKSATKFMNMTG